GSTILIGQAFGSGNIHAMKRVAGTTLSISVILGVIVALVGIFFSNDLLRMIGTPADILHDSTVYSQLIFFSCPMLFPYLAYTTFIRGTGDSQTPFYFLIVSAVLIAVLTPAFILGWVGLPRLGVSSAAIAGYISNAIAFVALLVLLARRKDPLSFDFEMMRDIRIDWK